LTNKKKFENIDYSPEAEVQSDVQLAALQLQKARSPNLSGVQSNKPFVFVVADAEVNNRSLVQS
jgi:hypothetical protein